MEQKTIAGASEPDTKKALEELVRTFLKIPVSGSRAKELEVRFGTNSRLGRSLTKLDYDSVVQHLYAAGFQCLNTSGVYYLRIYSEYTDNEGRTKMSNIRAEIVGTELISNYCNTNSIQKLLDMPSSMMTFGEKIKFTQKILPRTTDGKIGKPVNFDDMGFRVAYQYEQDYSVHSNVAKTIIAKWVDSKKTYRHMNRIQFTHPSLPFIADLSIVRSSAKSGPVPIPQYTVQDAKVFTNEPQYEIELELDTTRVGPGTKYSTPELILDAMRYMVRVVLSGIQGSAYPIGQAEQTLIGTQYMRMVHGGSWEPRKYGGFQPRDFIGPSSVSLQMEHISEPNPNSTEPNIRNGYTVTEKADGDRKMLYVANNGRVYFLSSNMGITFTGAMVEEKALWGTLFDGEHIRHDKKGRYINLYAAFDVYYVHEKSVREFPFMKPADDTTENSKYRLLLLNKLINDMLKLKYVGGENNNPNCNLTVKCKEFEIATDGRTIFDCCARILGNVADGLYQYETDGLIFTPIHLGVGQVKPNGASPNRKETWKQSMKWKPPKYNTVDFLVSVKKNKEGKDEVHTQFVDGQTLTHVDRIKQYKTLVLRCGFDETRDGYLNPFQTMLYGKEEANPATTQPAEEGVKRNSYFPAPFIPTEPYDANACYCNVVLQNDSHNNLVMMTEEGEYFEEDMIVEFSHDVSAEGAWRWKPLRVRYDKTAALRAGASEYGNAYKTANSNWRSIYVPITEEILTTGRNIPEVVENDEVYYNNGSIDTNTQALRDFHNLVVKRKLILGVSQRGDTLIDYAVGKGGDLPKWNDAKLAFVLGVDVSKDNINNRLNGACARYLNMKETNKTIPDALFVHGNSALNIRDGSAFHSDKERMLVKGAFGTGARERKQLGAMVFENYGVGHAGFQISSVQFALHYFCESPTTFYSFIQNVAECTKLGGYFIGTCYDGREVFKQLQLKLRGESVTLMKNGNKIFEIVKEYDMTGFPDDDLSLGYAINVYQESINKYFREYLVNYDFLVRTMENYGFVLATKEEAVKMGLPAGSGLFSGLFQDMELALKRSPKLTTNYKQAPYMSEEEKQISFMNRYFVFRKTTQVDTKKMAKLLSLSTRVGDESDVDDDNESGVSGITKLASKYDKPKMDENPTDEPPTKQSAFIRVIDYPKFIISEYDEVADVNAPEEITLVHANELSVAPVPTIVPHNSVVISEDVVANADTISTPAPAPASTIIRTGVKRIIKKPKT